MDQPSTDTIGEAFTRIDDKVRLVGIQCSECGEVSFPPRSWCPTCSSEEVSEMVFDRTGTLETYSVVHVPQKGFESPYAVGFARLSPGNVRVFGPMKGVFEEFDIGREIAVTMLSPEDEPVPTKMWGFTANSAGGDA